MNRRSFLRALGFGLPAAGVCAVIPATALGVSVAEASIGVQGKLAIGVLSGDRPSTRVRVVNRTGAIWHSAPEVVYSKKDAPVHVIRFLHGAGAERSGVTDASTFPKA